MVYLQNDFIAYRYFFYSNCFFLCLLAPPLSRSPSSSSHHHSFFFFFSCCCFYGLRGVPTRFSKQATLFFAFSFFHFSPLFSLFNNSILPFITAAQNRVAKNRKKMRVELSFLSFVRFTPRWDVYYSTECTTHYYTYSTAVCCTLPVLPQNRYRYSSVIGTVSLFFLLE